MMSAPYDDTKSSKAKAPNKPKKPLTTVPNRYNTTLVVAKSSVTSRNCCSIFPVRLNTRMSRVAAKISKNVSSCLPLASYAVWTSFSQISLTTFRIEIQISNPRTTQAPMRQFTTVMLQMIKKMKKTSKSPAITSSRKVTVAARMLICRRELT